MAYGKTKSWTQGDCRNGPYIGGRFLLVPSTARGNGTGHLKRSADLCKKLNNASLYIPKETSGKIRGIGEVEHLLRDLDPGNIITESGTGADFTAVITDTRKTSTDFFNRWLVKAKMIGLDEGGAKRNRYDYLIDTLPLPRRFPKANIASPLLLNLPKNRKKLIEGPRDRCHVLIAFGGEDPCSLTGKVVRALTRGKERRESSLCEIPDRFECTVVRGPFAAAQPFPPQVRVVEQPARLKDSLSAYDVVITGFGLTAYEAVFAGCGVICVNPTRYHHKLSRLAGFYEAGVRRVRRKRLFMYLSRAETLQLHSEKTADTIRKQYVRRDVQQNREDPDLASLLSGLDLSNEAVCPLCGKRGNEAVYRDPVKTVFFCRKCLLYYQTLFIPRKKDYNREYFFEEYRKQYGRTYLDDFDHIVSLGKQRLKEIRRVYDRYTGTGAFSADKRREPYLLDVGCAYGAFLHAAAEEGFSPRGIDISEDAAAYVRNELGYPVSRLDFEAFCGKVEYDVLTMWFVLEHFPNPARVLKKVSAVLKQGGVFAFSTPNGNGVSRRFYAQDYFADNPKDHYTIWSPRSVRRILSRFGFRVIRIKITGHHPERFPRMRKHSEGLLFRLTSLYSVLFRRGDTFEVYATKKNSMTERGRERKNG